METSRTPQDLSNSRLWDWRAALLTLLLVEISSARLAGTEWTTFLYFTQTMSFLGVILGLALGYSAFSHAAALRIAIIYTFALIPAQLLRAVEKTDWLWQDILALLDRQFFSLEQFLRNKPVEDPLFFVSFVTLAYWLIALAAGYWLARHLSLLNVTLPSALAILTVQSFDAPHAKHLWTLGLFVFTALALTSRLYFLKKRFFWNKSRFLLTDEAVSDMERGALATAAIAVFLAWSLPGWVKNIQPAAEAWLQFSQPIFEKLSNAVSALESSYTVRTFEGDPYGDSLSLGGEAASSENIIFTVKVGQSRFVPVRNYWKGRSYDLYQNGQWMTAEHTSEAFDPVADKLAAEYPQNRHQMEYTFTSRAKKQSLYYAPAGTVWISKEAKIQIMPAAAGVKDVAAWMAGANLSSGSQYKARALIADPSVKELRAAGAEYPAWVAERYLQIPAEVAPQFRNLALKITASHASAYDKAQAVTLYLREEIEYQAVLEENPPQNSDPVLWALLEYKKGFCTYYASAETLLLRSIGIPARMAVGFVEGEYDEIKSEYQVAYKDAHAWTEVYFPGVGWVEFEPTSNQTPLARPETRENSDETISDGDARENLADDLLSPNPLQELPEEKFGEASDIPAGGQPTLNRNLMAAALALLSLVFVIFIVRRYSLNERLPVYLAQRYERRGSALPRWLKQWTRWAALSPIERAFQAVNLSLSWLGQPQQKYITSQERAEILIKRLPAAEVQVRVLLQEYHNALYTLREGNLPNARKAALGILFKAWQSPRKDSLQFADNQHNELE